MDGESGVDAGVWYFAYASSMWPNILAQQMGGKPLESCPVVVPDAWLAFDYRGIPYTDPAHASLIIRGVNDGPFVNAREKGESTDTEAYKRYLHDRCCPGLPFDASDPLPPFVEGIAYRVSKAQLTRLQRTSGFDNLPVRCHRLEAESSEERVREPFFATALIARPRYRGARLMPSIRVFAMLYRGALVNCLSGRYLGHVSLLRPYNPEHAGHNAVLAQRLFKGLVLAPQFLVAYMPLVLVQKVLGSTLYLELERVKLAIADAIRWSAIVIERFLFRPIFGDIGYGIEQD